MTLQNLLPIPEQQFFDNNGDALANGKVYTYDSTGATPKATYSDQAGLNVNPNPVILDSAGRALIYGTGTYVLAVFDGSGNEIYAQASADPLSNLSSGAFGAELLSAATQADALSLLGISAITMPAGVIMPYASISIPSGWALCYGQQVSRTQYPTLFALLGTFFGAGDGVTTFNLPDLRGRAIFGNDSMGGTAANRLTTASITPNGGIFGSAGGDQLAQADAGTISVADPGHTHVENVGSGSGGSQGVWSSSATGNASGTLSVSTASSTTGVTASFTTALTGTQQNVPPAMVLNWIIFLGS